MIIKNKIFEILLLTFIIFLNISVQAQTNHCNLRLNVFVSNNTQSPQSEPIDGIIATAVDLNTNKISTSKIVDGKPNFIKLPEGEYNLIVGKAGFYQTRKKLNLICKFANQKKVLEQIFFLVRNNTEANPILTKQKFIGTYEMQQTIFGVSGEDSPYPAIPPPAKADSDYVAPIIVNSNFFINERAIYLPQPIFPIELKEKLKKSSTSVVTFSVQIQVDEKGNVSEVNTENDDEFSKYVIEAAKESKFMPVTVRGKLARLSGSVRYFFRTK